MGRRKLIDQRERIQAQVPMSISTKVWDELYSEVEGKVPFGAISELVSQLLADWLRSRGISI